MNDDDDLTKLFSRQTERCNGVPISKFREIAERYPRISGVWIDPNGRAEVFP